MSGRPQRRLITVKEAQEFVDGCGLSVTKATIINWAKDHKLGYQLGGPKPYNSWVIELTKLKEYLDGKDKEKKKTSG